MARAAGPKAASPTAGRGAVQRREILQICSAPAPAARSSLFHLIPPVQASSFLPTIIPLDAIEAAGEAVAALANHRDRRVVGEPLALADRLYRLPTDRKTCRRDDLAPLLAPRQQEQMRVEGQRGND